MALGELKPWGASNVIRPGSDVIRLCQHRSSTAMRSSMRSRRRARC